MPEPEEVTFLLGALRNGDAEAQARLMAVMYKELRQRAQVQMRRERREPRRSAWHAAQRRAIRLVTRRTG